MVEEETDLKLIEIKQSNDSKQIEEREALKRPWRGPVYGSRTLSKESREPSAEEGKGLDLGPTPVPRPRPQEWDYHGVMRTYARRKGLTPRT